MAPRKSGDVSQNEVALAQAGARQAEAEAKIAEEQRKMAEEQRKMAEARAKEAEELRKMAEIYAPGEGRSVRCHARLRGKSNDAVMILLVQVYGLKIWQSHLCMCFEGVKKSTDSLLCLQLLMRRPLPSVAYWQAWSSSCQASAYLTGPR